MRPLLLTALGAVALTIGGCASPGLARIGDDVAREHPAARFDRGPNLTLGPLSLGLARRFVGSGSGGDLDGLSLDGVRRVKVATFAVEGTLDPEAAPMPAALRRLVERDGWERLVVTRDGGEATWILARMRRGHLTDLFVASLDREELSLVRVSGQLDDALRSVLREHVIPSFRDE